MWNVEVNASLAGLASAAAGAAGFMLNWTVASEQSFFS